MPLVKGKSNKAVSANISELTDANASKSPGKKRSRKQIIKIALVEAGRDKDSQRKTKTRKPKRGPKNATFT